MPDETPGTSPTPQEMEVTRRWLQKWNKSNAPEEQVHAVVRAIAEGADKTREALAGVGITLRAGKDKEFRARIFPALAASIAALRAAQNQALAGNGIRDAVQAILSRERVEGPGFPMGELTIEPNVRASEQEVREMIDSMGIDGIYNTCIQMTGMEPPRHIIRVNVFEAHEEMAQASLLAPHEFRMRFHPEHRRVRLHLTGSEPTRVLNINYNFARRQPEEVPGVMFHEFGHHWTQKMHSSPHGNVAIMEGFAELMRIVAARREGTTWRQLRTRPLEILDGRGYPPVAAANYVPCDERLSFVSKVVASQRLMAHLGGVDERVMAGIARSCSYPGDDRTAVPLRQVMLDIERETGIAGFAQRCFDDPILYPGGLRTGEMAFANMNDAGNGYAIMRFSVPNNGGHYGWSMHEYPALPNNLTAADFMTQPIQTAPLPFGLDFQRPDGGIAFGIETNGSFQVTPEFIVKQVKLGQMQWQAGATRVHYRVNGVRTLLEHPLIITEEDLARPAL
jgi:hypothetical protein